MYAPIYGAVPRTSTNQGRALGGSPAGPLLKSVWVADPGDILEMFDI